ncbi:hypothetical protein QPM17_21410 [Marinobacter sp. TBZ242]|uniref:Putative metallopeptidase domain-containing protein n=1 Tax=Marinobacter azerbaijanicus TaxID=3050455 RepID=A0ABT7IJ01_9GAMM|nr:hypothetical protein [Marinobacter sp. TBZ242]MDL0433707.1 hypothetical protein [Marinobacter sp. TBZ242]
MTHPHSTLSVEPRTQPHDDQQLDRWLTDRARWQQGQPLTWALAAHLPLIEDTKLDTAATDGAAIRFNPLWSAGLDDATRCYMQAHLVWHCAAGHFLPVPVPDCHRWHLACDHEANAVLLLLGIALPGKAAFFPACIGKPLTEIHEWLKFHPRLAEEDFIDRLEPTAKDRTECAQAWAKRVDSLLAIPEIASANSTRKALWLIQRIGDLRMQRLG